MRDILFFDSTEQVDQASRGISRAGSGVERFLLWGFCDTLVQAYLFVIQAMQSVLIYSLGGALLVSLMSFIGVFTLSFRRAWLHKILSVLISLAAGALLGDAFLHLLPEVVEESGSFSVQISLLILCGILFFLVLEKFVLWHHHHEIETPEDHAKHQHHHRSLGVMNMVGGALHDFLDGMVIAAGFLVSPLVGVTTLVAVVLHEIPQEIGDFGVFIHSGYSVRRALLINFLSGLLGLLGAVFVIVLHEQSQTLASYLIPFTAGAFIYIAGSDLIPEIKKETVFSSSLVQLASFISGIGMMYLLTFFE